MRFLCEVIDQELFPGFSYCQKENECSIINKNKNGCSLIVEGYYERSIIKST